MDDRIPLPDDSLEWFFDGFADSFRADVDDRSSGDEPDTSDALLVRRRR